MRIGTAVTLSPTIALRPDARVDEGDDGRFVAHSPRGVHATGPLPAGVRAGLHRLMLGSATEDELCDLAGPLDPAALAALYDTLARLGPALTYRYTLPPGGAPLITVEPLTAWYVNTPGALPAGRPVVLSRFAYLRRYGGRAVLESPRSHARIIIDAPAVAMLLTVLAAPVTPSELPAMVPALRAEAITAVLAVLDSAAMLALVLPDGDTDEEVAPPLAQWEFHDLLFHMRSRSGRHDQPSGATYSFAGSIPPPPALKPPMSEQCIALARPDMAALTHEDVPFTHVLEERTSVRSHGDVPITMRALGEFLYRAARVVEMIPAATELDAPYESSRRPYPGGGAMYELELYLAVDRCAGLDAGLHHYDPAGHRLEPLSGRTPAVDALLERACHSADLPALPQILVVLAARFERMSWKYRSIAYAATLKNAGVLIQTMYLVATAMGLAPCALGGGDAEHFARTAGLDPLVESSVAELILGSRPDPP